jgi:hypothetical protein
VAQRPRDELTPFLPGLAIIDMVGGGVPIHAPAGMVYSTGPESWWDDQQGSYVVKGPEVGVVAAELAAYAFARRLNVAVPDWSAARLPSKPGIFFASHKLEGAIRDVEPWLRRRDPKLLTELGQIVILDIWLANEDRNLGNLLGRPAGENRRVELVAIDFEKAATLRHAQPIISTANLPPERLWPREDLGRALAGWPAPADFIGHVEGLADEDIQRVVDNTRQVLGDIFTWADSSINVLCARRRRIGDLAREVWR